MTTNAKGSSVCGTAPFQNYHINIVDFPTLARVLGVQHA